MWVSPSRKGTAATICCVVLGGYAFTVPWPNNALVDEGLRLQLYNLRPLGIGALLAFALVAVVISERRLGNILNKGTIRWAAALSMVFPFWYALIASIRGSMTLPVVGLYLLWSLASFVVFPAFIASRAAVTKLVNTLAVATVGVLVVAFALSMTADVRGVIPGLRTSGLRLLLGEEAPLGFLNGNYYTLLPQLLAVCATYRLAADQAMSARMRGLLIATVLGSAALILTAWSRNGLVFIVVFGATYLLLRRWEIGATWLVAISFALLLIVAAMMVTTNSADLNRVATGRLALWSGVSASIVDAPSPAVALLAGPMGAIEADGPIGYDPLADDKTYVKLRVDNCHLELFIEAGALGYLFFSLPYLCIAAFMVSRFRNAGPDYGVAVWWVALAAALFTQGLFIATIPTFNSPIGLAWAALTATPAAAMLQPVPDAFEEPHGHGATNAPMDLGSRANRSP